ncbi:MAG: 3-hydroxyacyl-CoA dehydrogenase family protein [Clostridiales bacterium]|nr:3-hydroxyacyl-CoA dehydrogenase family protein [Clostridiales bacterium]
MRKIKKVFVAGSGTMGMSIAQAFADKGYEVIVYDISEVSIKNGKKLLGLNQGALIKNGKYTQEYSDKVVDRISFTNRLELAKDTDFVTESVVEKLEIKHDFWKKISSIVDKDVLLTTNTSGISITAIAEAVKGPERFVGMHWFNPPHIIPLIEVINGDKTDNKNTEAVYQLSKDIGKKPIIVKKDVPGFIANRVQFTVLRELLSLVEYDVVSLEDADNVMKYGLGIRYACLGPFEIADMGGIDTFRNISDYLFTDLADDKDGSLLFRSLVDQGRLGVKSGAGIYDYEKGKAEHLIKERDEKYMKVCESLMY